MDLRIRPVRDTDVDDVVRLSLLAWRPVFESWERILGSGIFAILYPDWRTSQSAVVEEVCKDGEKTAVYVAETEGVVAGFVAYRLDAETMIGEVYLLAVHPDHQNQGVGGQLNELALSKMREGGMKLAYVGTGGDPGHAPARRSYEKAGYTTALPAVHYYQDLQ